MTANMRAFSFARIAFNPASLYIILDEFLIFDKHYVLKKIKIYFLECRKQYIFAIVGNILM